MVVKNISSCVDSETKALAYKNITSRHRKNLQNIFHSLPKILCIFGGAFLLSTLKPVHTSMLKHGASPESSSETKPDLELSPQPIFESESKKAWLSTVIQIAALIVIIITGILFAFSNNDKNSGNNDKNSNNESAFYSQNGKYFDSDNDLPSGSTLNAVEQGTTVISLPSEYKPTDKPSIPEESHEPSIPKESHEASIPEENYEPSIPKESHEASIPKESHEASIPEENYEPSITEESHEPSIPEENHSFDIAPDISTQNTEPPITKTSEKALETPKPSNKPISELPLSGAIIGIDAGHQGKGNPALEPEAPGSSQMKAKVTSGTSGSSSGVAEHTVNLQVALALEKKLIELGAEVVMVRRTANVDISNSQRAIMMNEAGVDFCLRIHANGSENKKTNGALMMVPSGADTKAINETSRKLGQTIFDSYLAATGAKNGGVLAVTNMTGFNWSTVPVCLIEMGYMSNSEEDLLLVSPEYQGKIVQGLVDGILLWYS